VLKGRRNNVEYPGHSHDYWQLYNYGEVLKAIRAACCLDVFHGLPVAREIEGCHHEADDIEGDDGQDNQVVI